jgi:acetylornithine deacetylase/succinyl-diaminopimelate desuccinylase family protein
MESVIQTLADLVSINSVNPAYAGGPGEAGVADYVEAFFRARGVETERQEVFPGRDNVIARAPGRDPGKWIVLEAHMDTVSVEGMTIPPFDPVIREGLLHGRGACDTKAGLAAMMHAAAEIAGLPADERPLCGVLLAAVVDEEHAYRGVVRLCDGLRAEAAVVAEPTELRAVICSKGVLRWKIRVLGRAAHSSKPHLGENAILGMARVIAALEEFERELGGRSHPLAGVATCNVGVIRGGVQVNFVPDQCEIELDRRLLPGETAAAALAEYGKLLARLDGIRVEMDEPMLVDEALDTPADSPVARAAAVALEQMGLDGALLGVPYGSDASKLSRAGVPSIVFGAGSIDRAHAAVEYVEVGQVKSALDFYRNFVLNFSA